MDILTSSSKVTGATNTTEYGTVNITDEMLKAINKIANTEGLLSLEDEYRLIEICKLSGDLHLGADVMFAKQYDSIVKMCKQFAYNHNRPEDIEDYIQSCYEYMLEAIDTFRFSAKVRFNTYLSTIIKKCLNDSYYASNGVSKYYQQEYFKIGCFKSDYEKIYGRMPTEEEIREALEYTETRLTSILNEARALNPIHFEKLRDDIEKETRSNENIITEDVLQMNEALRVDSAETIIINKERSDAIARLYKDLGPEGSDLLCRYSGIGYDKPQSKRRICRETGLSKATVNKAIELILEYAKEQLTPYYL